MGDWLNIIRVEPLTYLFKGITFLGNREFLYIFLPIIYWCVRKRAGAHLIILVILSSYLNHMLKELFGWERPPTYLWLVTAKGYAFPSTHSLLAVVIWGYLAYEIKRKWFTALAIALIVLIPFSRVYLGVHYPRDVIAGVAMGAIFLHAYRWSFRWIALKLEKVNDIIIGAAVIIISIILLLLQTNTSIAIATGMMAGIVAGLLFEPHFADFDPSGTLPQNAIKVVLGLFIAVAIWQGLEWIFPENASFKWFQFFCIGNWVMCGTPWSFIQLKLAQREL